VLDRQHAVLGLECWAEARIYLLTLLQSVRRMRVNCTHAHGNHPKSGLAARRVRTDWPQTSSTAQKSTLMASSRNYKPLLPCSQLDHMWSLVLHHNAVITPLSPLDKTLPSPNALQRATMDAATQWPFIRTRLRSYHLLIQRIWSSKPARFAA
jgi:hypothetical protein